MKTDDHAEGLTCTEYLSSFYSHWSGNLPSLCYWCLGVFHHAPNHSGSKIPVFSCRQDYKAVIYSLAWVKCSWHSQRTRLRGSIIKHPAGLCWSGSHQSCEERWICCAPWNSVAFFISAFFIPLGIYPSSHQYCSTWILKQLLPSQQLPSMFSLTLSRRVAFLTSFQHFILSKTEAMPRCCTAPVPPHSSSQPGLRATSSSSST